MREPRIGCIVDFNGCVDGTSCTECRECAFVGEDQDEFSGTFEGRTVRKDGTPAYILDVDGDTYVIDESNVSWVYQCKNLKEKVRRMTDA